MSVKLFSMNNFATGWYVIYTRPRYERKVSARLSELKIPCLFPTKKVLRTWQDRKKYVDEPLFPSYVFVYLDGLKSFYEGKDAEGAMYYVRTGKEMAKVSEAVVNNIRLISDKARELEISDALFRPGRRLVISKGALTGLSCEVVRVCNVKKLLVRVDLLQRSILATLPEECLMLA